jgi:hypothetical protein
MRNEEIYVVIPSECEGQTNEWFRCHAERAACRKARLRVDVLADPSVFRSVPRIRGVW